MGALTARLTAACVMTICFSLLGGSLASARRRAAARAEERLLALRRLRAAALGAKLPLVEALIKADDPLFSALAERLDEATDPARALSSLAGERISEARPLEELFSRLGASGGEEARLLFDEAEARLEAEARTARKKAEEQAKLYSSLGLLAGLAAAIMLL